MQILLKNLSLTKFIKSIKELDVIRTKLLKKKKIAKNDAL